MTHFWFFRAPLSPEELAMWTKRQAEWEAKLNAAWGKGWRERRRKAAEQEDG